jgi:tRNA (cytidine/uridine-2'-O-)-methyltransferase
MGFRIEDSKLKRAGLDYWHMLGVTTHPSLEEFVERHADDSLWLFTTKAKQLYTSVEYRDGDFLVFGKETAGLPRRILERFPERCVRIPMLDHPDARSLNLSNCVAIGVYEALRQCGKLDNTDI